MTTYPIKANKHGARHRGGTKDYHLVLLRTADGTGVLINRWGKANQSGQMEVGVHPAHVADQLHSKKWKAKFDGEYTDTLVDTSIVINDRTELEKFLGPNYRFNIGKEALLALDPTLDIAGVREPKVAKFTQNKDGTFEKVDDTKKADVIVPDKYENNDLAGSW